MRILTLSKNLANTEATRRTTTSSSLQKKPVELNKTLRIGYRVQRNLIRVERKRLAREPKKKAVAYLAARNFSDAF